MQLEFKGQLISGTLIRRYKRFLADVELESGEQVLVHVPNTGPMTSCIGERWPVLMSLSQDPKRKCAYTLEMTHNGQSWIGVNTQNPNRLVYEGLRQDFFPEFPLITNLQREKKIGESKLDFFFHSENVPCYVEVKNVTLKEDHQNTAYFPDTVTERGTKHLQELLRIKAESHPVPTRCAMLYIVQREDVDAFAPAAHLDASYAKALRAAYDAGVEIYAYQCQISAKRLILHKSLPILLN